MKNELTKISIDIDLDQLDECPEIGINKLISSLFNNIDYIYSYIIYNKNDKSTNFTENLFRVVCTVSNIQLYNEIPCNTLGIIISDCIINDNFQTNISGYGQPSLNTIVKTYRPLIKSLTERFKHQWPMLDYDDIYQSCMFALIKLRKSNYYLHRNLIVRTCTNEILYMLRPIKDIPNIVSLDDTIESSDNDKDIHIADTIMDENEYIEREENEHAKVIMNIFNELKDIIIDKIGQRRFDRLFDAYGKQKGNGAAAQDLLVIKRYLKQENITKQSFDKYF